MIRVLRVITRLNIGGPSHHVMILTAGLNDDGFSSRLICGTIGPDEGDLAPEAEARGIPLTRAPALSNRGGLVGAARTVWALYRQCRAWRPQIVHLHQFKARLLGAIAARAAGVPHIIQTYHGTLFDRYFRPPTAMVFMGVERCLGRWLTHRTIAVSNQVRRELLERRVVQSDKVTVVSLGLELRSLLQAPQYAGTLRRELGVPVDTLILGLIGRLVPIIIV